MPHHSDQIQNHKPILVTGGHRTGTTWVGRMLAASGEAAYISEPLNVLHRPGVMSAPVRHWYTYICPENEAEYLPALRQTLGFRYHLGREIASLRSRKDFLRMCRDGSTFLAGRFKHLRPLIKDPFAVFSAPWFASRLDCQVVITVRHPAAFASSLKRLGWMFQMHDLLDQPLLMRDYLEPYRSEMSALPDEDVVGRAALLWKMIYQVVDEYRRSHPNFLVVRHEDLSLDPLHGFRRLYSELDLDLTPGAQASIMRSSSEANPSEISSVHATRVDSRLNLGNWRRRLDPAEIDRIRGITAGVVEGYYPEGAWE